MYVSHTHLGDREDEAGETSSGDDELTAAGRKRSPAAAFHTGADAITNGALMMLIHAVDRKLEAPVFDGSCTTLLLRHSCCPRFPCGSMLISICIALGQPCPGVHSDTHFLSYHLRSHRCVDLAALCLQDIFPDGLAIATPADSIDASKLAGFTDMYRQHCNDVIENVRVVNFAQVHASIIVFFTALAEKHGELLE